MAERVPIDLPVGGLNTLVNALVGNPAYSPDCSDISVNRGLIQQRGGFRILDIEPSHTNDVGGTDKALGYLSFDGSNDKAVISSFTGPLGTKWTLRWDLEFANAANALSGTYQLLHIPGTTYDPLSIQAIGDGTTITLRVITKDNAGNSVTLNSTARTPAEWQTAGPYASANFVRVVRDEETVYLYVAETLEDSDTGFTVNAHEAPTSLYVGCNSSSANFATLVWYGSLVIVNRVMAEAEAYWGINWPIDSTPEADVIGHWLCYEGSGTTINDFSSYARDMTITGATWTQGTHRSGRGLGVYNHRTRTGDLYHIICASRRADSSTGAVPTGAIYAWKANRAFLPFYFGADPAADDATATAAGATCRDGFDLLARWYWASAGDLALGANGVDRCMKFGGTTAQLAYLGISAPPCGPDCTATGSGGAMSAGVVKYVQTFYNNNTGTESGASQAVSVTVVANDSVTVAPLGSNDTQVTHIRVYRTTAGGTTYTMVKEVANSGTASFSDGLADAAITNNLLLTGVDLAGNLRRKRMFGATGPPTAPTLADGGAGTATGGSHRMAYSWANSTTGEESGWSPATTIALAANRDISMSAMVLPTEGTKYDKMNIYSTKNGNLLWFLVAQITPSATYTVTAVDANFTTANDHLKGLPPIAKYPTMFANRLWMASGSTLYWSGPGLCEAFPWANAHIANSGAEITGIGATEGMLFVSYNDGRVFGVPHPGNEVDLDLFVPINMREIAPKGGAVGHGTIQKTPYGLVWLARDGFYAVTEGRMTLISPLISPDFLNLNRVRAKYGCSLWLDDEGIYVCWVARSTKRLNEEAFVWFAKENRWVLWNIHADAAGELLDGNETPHYCFLVENGVLCELDLSVDYDGDGGGTTSGTGTNKGIARCAEVASYTQPVGGDGGYPVYLVKSDGTTGQRYVVDSALTISGTKNITNFYPSYSAFATGTWTVYMNGIRGRFKTMFLPLGDRRRSKSVRDVVIYTEVQTSGALGLKVSCDQAAAETLTPTFDITKVTSRVPVWGNATTADARVFQFEFFLSPPAASRPWAIDGIEAEVEYATSDVGAGG